jgi:hypothetical protein
MQQSKHRKPDPDPIRIFVRFQLLPLRIRKILDSTGKQGFKNAAIRKPDPDPKFLLMMDPDPKFL